LTTSTAAWTAPAASVVVAAAAAIVVVAAAAIAESAVIDTNTHGICLAAAAPLIRLQDAVVGATGISTREITVLDGLNGVLQPVRCTLTRIDAHAHHAGI
jgi:hypothetical protein